MLGRLGRGDTKEIYEADEDRRWNLLKQARSHQYDG